MWRIPDTFIALPLDAAPKPSVIPAPMINNATEKKKLFAMELVKASDPFQAACNICGQNTQEALWISKNWITDPEVLGHKDSYLNSVATSKTLLDKEEVAAKLLGMAEEKADNGMFYILEGKDRLKALELYAKIQGYLDNKDKQTNNFVHNSMIVKFVKPDEKTVKTIDHTIDEYSNTYTQ